MSKVECQKLWKDTHIKVYNYPSFTRIVVYLKNNQDKKFILLFHSNRIADDELLKLKNLTLQDMFNSKLMADEDKEILACAFRLKYADLNNLDLELILDINLYKIDGLVRQKIKYYRLRVKRSNKFLIKYYLRKHIINYWFKFFYDSQNSYKLNRFSYLAFNNK